MISRTFMIRSCLVAAAAFAFLAPSMGFSQNASERSLDQFTCKQVMREPQTAREATIAFMHGYLLAKSNLTKFNIETLLKRTDSFIDACLDNPSAKAIDVMTKAGG